MALAQHIYIPYAALPDSWVRIPWDPPNDNIFDDLIFLDGRQFSCPFQALAYATLQFGGDASLARQYMHSLQDKEQEFPIFFSME